MKSLILYSFVFLFTINLLAQDEATLVKVGDKAPDFTIELENGKTKQLSDLKGKVVWIKLFCHLVSAVPARIAPPAKRSLQQT